MKNFGQVFDDEEFSMFGSCSADVGHYKFENIERIQVLAQDRGMIRGISNWIKLSPSDSTLPFTPRA